MALIPYDLRLNDQEHKWNNLPAIDQVTMLLNIFPREQNGFHYRVPVPFDAHGQLNWPAEYERFADLLLVTRGPVHQVMLVGFSRCDVWSR